MTKVPLFSAFSGEKKKPKGIIVLPEKGDTGGVEPAGDAGGVAEEPLFWYPGGLTIMILLVTFFVSSVVASPPYDLIALPPLPSDSIHNKKRLLKKSKLDCNDEIRIFFTACKEKKTIPILLFTGTVRLKSVDFIILLWFMIVLAIIGLRTLAGV